MDMYDSSMAGSGQFGICERCKLPPTKQGHDGCLGELQGDIMNACCGHGNTDIAYIQYWSKEDVRGADAISEQQKLIKERALGYEYVGTLSLLDLYNMKLAGECMYYEASDNNSSQDGFCVIDSLEQVEYCKKINSVWIKKLNLV